MRIQTDTLPYAANRIDLDPVRRDRTGFGLPVARVTYEVRAAERRLYERMMTEAERLQAEMGAELTWRGPCLRASAAATISAAAAWERIRPAPSSDPTSKSTTRRACSS